MTGSRAGMRVAQESLPKISDSCSEPQSATPPLPSWPRPYTLRWLQPQGQFQTNKKPVDARVMEHRETEPRGVDTEEKPISRQRPPQLPRARPTLYTIGRPSPFRPADPAATEPVIEVSLLSSRTQTHFPRAPASWLSSSISRTAGGEGFKLRSLLVPTGPVAVHSDPTLLSGHALPTPGPQSSGDQPCLLHSLGPSALLPLAPHARSHPGILGGAGVGSRRGKKELKRGGFRFRSHLHLGPRG